MTSIGLSLLILASGWTLYRLWLRTRYRALKDSGHPQYFAAVVAAAYLLLVASSLRLVAIQCWGESYRAIESGLLSSVPLITSKDEKAQAFLGFAAVTAWSMLVVYPISLLMNAPIRRSGVLLRGIIKKAAAYDQLEAVTGHVLERGLSLAVTLDSGKVYVGAPIKSSTLDEEKKWLAIFPLVSGARDEKGRLEITTKYLPVYEKMLLDLTPEKARVALQDFQVALPISKIASFQVFDLETYNKFRSGGLAEDSPSRVVSESPSTSSSDVEPNAGAPAEDLQWINASLGDFTQEELFKLRIYYASLAGITLSIVLLPHVRWDVVFFPITASILLAASISD